MTTHRYISASFYKIEMFSLYLEIDVALVARLLVYCGCLGKLIFFFAKVIIEIGANQRFTKFHLFQDQVI